MEFDPSLVSEKCDSTFDPLEDPKYGLEDDVEEVAACLGKEVVVPGPRDVFVDIDSPEDLVVFATMFAKFQEVGLDWRLVRRVESSPGHYHLYVRVDRDLSAVERIAIQAVLGSDRKRETLSLCRIYKSVKRHATVFFEKSENVESQNE